jgi:PAS domain S-box-containing protein
MPSESRADDVLGIRKTMRDLVALSTLPAVWAGYAPEGLAKSLAEVLLSTLSLDLVFVRVRDKWQNTEVAHRAGEPPDPRQVQPLIEAFAPWLTSGAYDAPASVVDPLTGSEWRVAVARFGYTGNDGAVIACSRRPDFPSEAERLLLGVSTNQTAIVLQRNRAQRSLAEEQERLRITLASIGDAVIATDANGRVTFSNDVAESLTGWPSADAIGKPLSEIFRIVNQHSREPGENPALRALREGRVVGLANHTVLLAKDGRERLIDDSAAPIRSESGTIVGAVLVFRDVTDRRGAEEAQARLAAIVESSHDAIVSKSLDGTIMTWNAGAERIFGYSEHEAVGQPITLIIPPELLDEEKLILGKIRNGEPIEHFETIRVTKGGQRLHISLTVSPIRNAEGKVVGASKVARNITDRIELERALRAADHQKDDFIALLAHELRNPLAPIRNGLQALRLAEGDQTVAANAQAMMERQLSHMVRLVDDLLDVSRINRSKMELRRQRVSLADIVNAAVETARPAIDHEEHHLAISLPTEPVHLDADLTRLSQVFSNLLTNSAKYTGRGGRIWLTAEKSEGFVTVSVRDTGIGIPPESLPNIFDMFSQVDRSVEKSTGGLGIGLALVKGLVEMHAGTVQAESAGQGKGSKFVVMLPVLPEQPAAAPEMPPKSVPAAGPRRRILVVDDNRDGADSLAMVLRLQNNEVRTARDGLEAVQQAELFRPEIVLMDVGLPKLNGLEATRRIREQVWGKGMTIIALTGWGQDRDREQSQEAGCDGHLVKPVELAELQKMLADLQKNE